MAARRLPRMQERGGSDSSLDGEAQRRDHEPVELPRPLPRGSSGGHGRPDAERSPSGMEQTRVDSVVPPLAGTSSFFAECRSAWAAQNMRAAPHRDGDGGSRLGRLHGQCHRYCLHQLHRILVHWVPRLNSSLVGGRPEPRLGGSCDTLGSCSSRARARKMFDNEVLETELDLDEVSDAEEHPWQALFVHGRGGGRGLWERLAGAPTSERRLLGKAGIERTRRAELQEFLQGIKGRARKPRERAPRSPGGAAVQLLAESPGSSKSLSTSGSAAMVSDGLDHILSDWNVKWTYYDAFKRVGQRRDAPLDWGVVSDFSLLSLMSNNVLACIAAFSIWYSTLTYAFERPLAADLSFGPGTTACRLLQTMDVVLDVVYLAGVLLRLRTTVVNPQHLTEVVMIGQIMALTLVCPFFWADVLTAAVAPVRLALGLRTRWSLRLGVTRLLRSWRLLLPEPDPVGCEDRWTWSMVKSVLLLLLCGHVFGCAWFVFCTEFTDIESHALVLLTAPSQVAAFDETSWPLALHYSYAWRIGIYIVLGADWIGMSSVENFFTTGTTLLGVLLSALLFSQVIVMMQRGSSIQTMYAQHVIEVKQALALLDLPQYLQLRILAFYAYQELHRSEHTAASLRRALSTQLHFELHFVLYYGLVNNANLFKSMAPQQLRALVMLLKDRLLLPGDYVYRARDQASEMFFISKGRCSVLSADLTTQVKLLEQGDSFGEVALLCGEPHSTYIRADTYCILAVLDKVHFDNLLRLHPKMAEILVKHMSAEERALMKTREGFIVAARRTAAQRRANAMGRTPTLNMMTPTKSLVSRSLSVGREPIKAPQPEETGAAHGEPGGDRSVRWSGTAFGDGQPSLVESASEAAHISARPPLAQARHFTARLSSPQALNETPNSAQVLNVSHTLNVTQSPPSESSPKGGTHADVGDSSHTLRGADEDKHVSEGGQETRPAAARGAAPALRTPRSVVLAVEKKVELPPELGSGSAADHAADSRVEGPSPGRASVELVVQASPAAPPACAPSAAGPGEAAKPGSWEGAGPLLVSSRVEMCAKLTVAMRRILKDLALADHRTRDAATAVEGICEELRAVVPARGAAQAGHAEAEEIDHAVEPEIAAGGFGAFEVMPVVDLVLAEVRFLRAAAQSVAAECAESCGADEVLVRAMKAAESGGSISMTR